VRSLTFAYVADVEVPVLDEADHHHLARVRRVRDGDPMIVGDGAGRWRMARFAAAPEPTGEVQFRPRSQPEVGVGFALVKGSKPELVVQKLTELGVDRIVPFVAARSVVRWDESKADAAHQRLQKVAREAGIQSRRHWLPEVAPVATFAEVAAQPGAAIADMDGRPPTLEHPFVLVGPEGGWAPEERRTALPAIALVDGGVLRAETAAIVAGSLLVALRAGLVGGIGRGERARGSAG
jgi:16S rRNA (uracil1498-N3)-methyltransferase